LFVFCQGKVKVEKIRKCLFVETFPNKAQEAKKAFFTYSVGNRSKKKPVSLAKVVKYFFFKMDLN
jgi:hypothetical protein